MSFSSQLSSRCSAPCAISCPQPAAEAWSQPCVTSCGDSRAVIHPPPVLITFPGPILSSCPQESIVGSAFPWGTERPVGLQGSLVYGGFFPSSSSSSCSSGNVWGRRAGGCGPW